RLRDAYNHREGIYSKVFPYRVLPEEMVSGSNEHLLFLTFVSGIAYHRKEELLWNSARMTYSDPKTKYLFNPEKVLEVLPSDLEQDLLKYKLFVTPSEIKKWNVGKLKNIDRSSVRENDLYIWVKMAKVLKKYDSDIKKLFEAFDNDALKLLKAFSETPYTNCFPEYSKERKVIIWLTRLKTISDLTVSNFENLPVPIGSHIVRATFMTGAISGKITSFQVDFEELLAEYWKTVYEERNTEFDETLVEFIPYLWFLSKFGCAPGKVGNDCRNKAGCPVKDLCTTGKVEILDNYITIDN
ncbi:hypothetical protein KAU33_08010, partial [Candidatus Dependentiae bacterium]|nr:hypothetical protein [Candidatus Dependentiae bacterium]